MDSNKNICLSVVYPNKSIYSETFIRNQLKYLNPEFQFYNDWYPYRNKNGNNFLAFPIRNALLRGIIKRISINLFHSLYTKQFSLQLNKNKINVVLAEYGPTGCSVMDACRINNVPLIVHFHGFDASDNATIRKYTIRYKKLFNISRFIIVVSEDMKKKLMELGAPRDKIINNPYGVELDLFEGSHPENNPPVFIAVGRFAEKKAPGLTIKAFSEVHRRYKETRLLMIGDGPLLNDCKKLVNELKLNGAVEFKGVLTSDEIKSHLKNARAFVQHSVTAGTGDMEGTPNTILEASAMGLPVISTYHAGIKEAVVHKKTGFLVQEKDFLKMAEYMMKVIENPELAGRLGRSAREHMEKNYSMPYRIKNLQSIIESAVNDGNKWE